MQPSSSSSSSLLHLLALLALLGSPAGGCFTRLRPEYVAPAALENCVACEQESSSWSWPVKVVWFIVTIVTHIQYECCHVPVEPATNRVFRRRWTSVEQCGKRGKSLRRLLKERNTTVEERIIKDGRDPARVVGGEITGELEVPWQVAILRSDGRWDGCGGLLLSCRPPIIITAAHCVASRAAEEVKVALGIHNLDDLQEENRTNIYQLEKIIIHPEFGPINVHARNRAPRFFFNGINLTVVENDIAILQIKNQEKFKCVEKQIWPACLPSKTEEIVGASGLVTGWGKTADGGHWSNVLRKVKIPIVPDQQCVNNVFHHSIGLHNIFTLSPNQFCAGDIVKRKGPCEGDSGSPLVVKTGPGQWSGVGLVSWRNRAGTPGGGCTGETFTVFTEISRYLDWIARESDLLPPLS